MTQSDVRSTYELHEIALERSRTLQEEPEFCE